MMKNSFLILVFIFIHNLLNAQVLSKEIVVSKLSHAANEPAISINPKRPKKIVVATNTKNIYWSKNGGKKFHHYEAKSSHGVYGDPVLMYDKQGVCYYVHLAEAKNKEWPDCFEEIVVQTSTNNGKKFNDGIGIGKNGKMQDKAWISMNQNSSTPFYKNTYITWTEFDKYGSKNPADSSRILFSTIKNNIATKPVQVNDLNGNCIDSDSTMEGATTAVSSKGELFVAWAGNEKIYFDKSIDNGKSWNKDIEIASSPKGWDLTVPDFYRTNGMPFLTIDKKENLFVCAAFEENNFNRVFVFESNNKGSTWKKSNFPLLDSTTHYMMPHAFVDASSGNYFVLYYGVKNNLVDVFLSYKLQNAVDFKTIKVNEKSVAVPKKEIFFGDYINVCAVGKTVGMVWTEANDYTTFVKFRKLILEEQKFK